MTAIQETIIYTLVALITVTLMYAFKPHTAQSPQGIMLPLGKQKQVYPQSSQVTLYDHMPAHAIILGTIHSQYFSSNEETARLKGLTQFASQKIAALGANGLVIARMSYQHNDDYPALSAFHLEGSAIITPGAS